jgi:NADP-dependent 3-hydroxy acid dehydrogenase YdfG
MALRAIRGTTVVITGGTSGIGLETGREFARAGARVVLAGRREDRLKDAVKEIESRGGEALGVRTDGSAASTPSSTTPAWGLRAGSRSSRRRTSGA